MLAGDHVEVGDDAVPPAAVLSPVHLQFDMPPRTFQANTLKSQFQTKR